MAKPKKPGDGLHLRLCIADSQFLAQLSSWLKGYPK